jgi:hypothetical protein
MKRFQAFHDCVIGIDHQGNTFLVQGPPKLYRVLCGPCLPESCQREGFDRMRGRASLYRATIICRWHRGSFAGVLAGEEPAVELIARDVEVAEFEGLANHRFEVVFGYATTRGGLRAQFSRGLRRLRTRVLQYC